MSLRDGTKKMSKSDPSDMSRINLTDDADTIAKKIRKAKTDPEPLPPSVKGLEGRPEAENLVGIYAALAEHEQGRVLREFGGQFSALQAGARRARRHASSRPIGGEMRRLMADPAEIDRILDDGARRAHAIADPILAKTKDIVGFIRS